jgi:hypothetical protein
MVLAAIDSTGYKIVLILHIVAVIVGFGGFFLAPMLRRSDGSQATHRGDDAMSVNHCHVPRPWCGSRKVLRQTDFVMP